MTVLARFPREGRPDLVAIECDLCVPPVLSTSTEQEMRELGWLLAADGREHDVCPWCDLSVPARNRRPRTADQPADPDPARLPNLLVIGAAKAGTTSLHNYLALHPDVCMSEDKEMRFFTDPDHRAWLGRYQAYFSPEATWRGESTPQYTKWPLFPGVVDRIADLVPDARLVYVLRDPVERAIAEYVEEVTWGVIGDDFEAEVSDAEAAYNRVLAPSRYATQLREFRRRFPAEQILLVELEDLAARPVETMAEVFAFLGLAPVPLDDEALAPRNAWGSKGVHPRWYRALRRPALVRLAHRMPTGWLARMRAFVARRVSTPVARPRPSEATLARVRAVLEPEMDELRRMSGRPFDQWSV